MRCDGVNEQPIRRGSQRTTSLDRCRLSPCPAGERPLSAQSDEGAPVESCQEPPVLHGVKSPARLATSSGGLVFVHDRPSGEPPELLARPRGCPRRDWTPLAADGCRRSCERRKGASFATNEANPVQTQTDRAPATPTPRPDRPQHSLLRLTDHRLPHLPHFTITSSPSAPTSDCSTRVALEARARVADGDNGGFDCRCHW